MRLLLLFISFALVAQEQDQETNNQTADNFGTNNNNSTVSSFNETTANTNNYSGAGSAPGSMPVGSAVAPSLMSSGMDSCLMSASNGLQLFSLGASSGRYKQDEECNRRRDAKVLSDLNMKVASIALMCQDQNVWDAMFMSGTPCPILVNSKLVAGRAAYLAMKQNPQLYIPSYGKVKETKETGYKCTKNKKTQRIIRCDLKPTYVIETKYSTKQLWYNTILNIYEQVTENISTSSISLSEQYRPSLKLKSDS